MTNSQKIEMFSMRLNGSTFQQIGDKFGVSKQYVQQELKSCVEEKKNSKYGFVNLKRWLNENDFNLTKLSKHLDITQRSLSSKMNNKNRGFYYSEINKILELTGMTYEEAFLYVEKEDNQQ